MNNKFYSKVHKEAIKAELKKLIKERIKVNFKPKENFITENVKFFCSNCLISSFNFNGTSTVCNFCVGNFSGNFALKRIQQQTQKTFENNLIKCISCNFLKIPLEFPIKDFDLEKVCFNCFCISSKTFITQKNIFKIKNDIFFPPRFGRKVRKPINLKEEQKSVLNIIKIDDKNNFSFSAADYKNGTENIQQKFFGLKNNQENEQKNGKKNEHKNEHKNGKKNEQKNGKKNEHFNGLKNGLKNGTKMVGNKVNEIGSDVGLNLDKLSKALRFMKKELRAHDKRRLAKMNFNKEERERKKRFKEGKNEKDSEVVFTFVEPLNDKTEEVDKDPLDDYDDFLEEIKEKKPGKQIKVNKTPKTMPLSNLLGLCSGEDLFG